jgi:hypothetical protein
VRLNTHRTGDAPRDNKYSENAFDGGGFGLTVPIYKNRFRHPNDEDSRCDQKAITRHWRMAARKNVSRVILVSCVVGSVDMSEGM